MDSWNDPVIQRAAELCYLIDDHRFTPLFGLHACINGNDDFLIRESSIKIVECIIASKQDQGQPSMTFEERCFQIQKRAKRLPNMRKANSIDQISLEHFRSKKLTDVIFLANGGKPVNNTRHNANGLYKSIQRYIERRAKVATTAVIDDDTSLLWLPPTNASPASSNARSSMSSMTAPSFEYVSPSNLTAPFERKLHCCLGTVWLGTLSDISTFLILHRGIPNRKSNCHLLRWHNSNGFSKHECIQTSERQSKD